MIIKKIYCNKDLGAVIRQKRKSLKMTQNELSKSIGVSTSFISDLERGKKTVEIDKAIFVANNLGLDLEVKARDGSR